MVFHALPVPDSLPHSVLHIVPHTVPPSSLTHFLSQFITRFLTQRLALPHSSSHFPTVLTQPSHRSSSSQYFRVVHTIFTICHTLHHTVALSQFLIDFFTQTQPGPHTGLHTVPHTSSGPASSSCTSPLRISHSPSHCVYCSSTHIPPTQFQCSSSDFHTQFPTPGRTLPPMSPQFLTFTQFHTQFPPVLQFLIQFSFFPTVPHIDLSIVP